MARLIDLSHEIEHGMVTYRGLLAPTISDWLSRDASRARYAPGTTFQMGKIELLANTGTYLDAPFHRYADGKDVAGYALEAVADLPGIVIGATERRTRALDASRFAKHDVNGKAVLVHTGWDAHWRTETYSAGEHPFLTREAAEQLASLGARSLLGLYQGVPRTSYGADGAPVANKITLFRGPLMRAYPSRDALMRGVRETFDHEVAHHLGISDARMQELRSTASH